MNKKNRYILLLKETSAVIMDTFFPGYDKNHDRWDYNSPMIISFVVLPHDSAQKSDRIKELELQVEKMNNENLYDIDMVAEVINEFSVSKLRLMMVFPKIQEIRIL